MRTPAPYPTATADPIARLLSAFFAGRSPHTRDAYTRDLDDFCEFLRRHTLTDRNPIGQGAQCRAVKCGFPEGANHGGVVAPRMGTGHPLRVGQAVPR